MPDVGAPGVNAVLADFTISMDSLKLKAMMKVAASRAVPGTSATSARYNGEVPRGSRPGKAERAATRSAATSSGAYANQTAKPTGGAVAGATTPPAARR